ncbi:TPA: DNA repair protein RecO [candidate division WOR-3 bacterium]|jgi:DNA repair protein RecO|uniref:DNA repair protein RecO n=1 Tax=candidate division WOR-3 bacterium TaxID=2052148 RepID=A0A350HB26_UNCW3|nr:DNA repair protein RecO [candidate division WOR-3 bacterium]
MKEGYVKSECLVIKKSRFKESSALVEIFSPLLGRHVLVARGIYRKKKSLSSHLEPLSVNNIEFFYKEGRQMHTITRAELIFYPENILKDLEAFGYAAKSLKILRKQEYPTESIKALYKTMRDSIMRFNNESNTGLVYLDFLRTYLYLEGHLNELYMKDERFEGEYDEKRIAKTINHFEGIIKRHED